MPKPKTRRNYFPIEVIEHEDGSYQFNSRDYGTLFWLNPNDHFDTEEANEYERQETKKLAEWLEKAITHYAAE